MNKAIWIIIMICCALTTFSQDTNIVFEQVALDFFSDSIVNHKEPFRNIKVHFNGQVDSSITIIDYMLIYKYPEDKELNEQYGIWQTADNEFWNKNKKGTFELNTKYPIKKRNNKKYYCRNSKVVRLRVFQNIRVGQRNYVHFRTLIKSGVQGYDLYFIMDNNGNVLDWIKTSFIY